MAISKSSLICPSCGAGYERDDLFCGECGNKLTESHHKNKSDSKARRSESTKSKGKTLSHKPSLTAIMFWAILIISLSVFYFWYQKREQSNPTSEKLENSDTENFAEMDEKTGLNQKVSNNGLPYSGTPTVAPSEGVPMEKDQPARPLISGEIPQTTGSSTGSPPLQNKCNQQNEQTKNRRILSLGSPVAEIKHADSNEVNTIPDFLKNESQYIQNLYKKIVSYDGDSPEDILDELEQYEGEIPEEMLNAIDDLLLTIDEENLDSYRISGSDDDGSISVIYQNDDAIVDNPDIPPYFLGCIDADCSDRKLKQYFRNNLQYPSLAKKKNIKGKAIVEFIVEKNGLITNAKVIGKLGYGCDQEALRLVMNMNQNGFSWFPGVKNNRSVRVKKTLPVQFE